jgi:formylglycine-generating enzyme required for sulfatase activity
VFWLVGRRGPRPWAGRLLVGARLEVAASGESHRAPFWNDEQWNTATRPVVGVSYWEAEAFATWAGGRLLAAREWEAAARGPEGYVYPWGDTWEDGICNSEETALGVTSPVGLFPRSRSKPFGLQDMAGNVWEWCQDLWDPGDSIRVNRGGGWGDPATYCRSADRSGVEPEDRFDDMGFRVSQVLADESGEPAEPVRSPSGGEGRAVAGQARAK